MRLLEISKSFPKQDEYTERTVKNEFGNEYVYSPSILDIEKGNMIRVYEQPKRKNNVGWYETWGTIVLDIDYKKELILVADSLGYPAERKEWVPLSDVYVTWNVGGFDKAMELLSAFSATVSKADKERKDLEKSAEIDKHVSFRKN